MDNPARLTLGFLLTSQAVSELGDWLVFISIVNTLYELGESSLLLGVFFTIQSLTTLLVAPLAGYFLEKVGYSRLLYLGRLLQAASLVLPLGAITLLAASSKGTFIFILLSILPVLRGVDIVADVGLYTLLPKMFSGEDLLRANATFSTASNGLMVILPAFAGIILSYLDFPKALLVDIVSYLLAGVLVIPILQHLSFAERKVRDEVEAETRPRSQPSLGGQIRELLATLRLVPVAPLAVLIAFLFMLGGGAINTIMPAFALTIGDTRTYGYITSLTGLGFLVTSTIMMARPSRLSTMGLVRLGLGIIFVADITWWLSQNAIWATVIAFVNGVGNELYGLGFRTLLQTSTTAAYLPRLLAAVSIAREGATILSPVLGGVLGELLGIRYVFFFAALLVTTSLVSTFWSKRSAT